VACTVVTRSYLAHARVLAASFREHHRDVEFALLLLDDDEHAIGPDEPFFVVRPDELGIDRTEFRRRGAMFGPLGLVSTTKSLLVRLLLRRFGSVVFLDADSCVYGSLAHVFDLATEHGVVLSPHLPTPISRGEAGYPLEETFLKYGVFNGGWLAVGPGGAGFLEWWCDRCARRCVEAPGDGYLYSQLWLTLAPAFFDCHVLRDPGVNVMWWNLYDRDVDWQGDTPTISGGPLRQFHFTGFDPAEPTIIGRRGESARANFPGLEHRPGVARLCREYAERVVAAGLQDARAHAAPFDVLPDGTLFSAELRTRYREAVEAAELSGSPGPPNPFD
jgi:hypothetical protein